MFENEAPPYTCTGGDFMQSVLDRERFDEALHTVLRAVAPRPAIPVLAGIWLEASGERLLLRAADLERTIVTTVAARVVEPGAIVLPGRYLAELVHRLPVGEVTVTDGSGGATARIACADGEYEIHTLPAQEFPREQPPAGPGAITAEPSALAMLLRETVFAAASDESRPWFTGVFLTLFGNRMVAMATDAAVLAYGEAVVANPLALTMSVILPGAAAQELVRLLGGAPSCEIILMQNQLRFVLGATTLATRLLEGQYPDFRRQLPAAYPSTFTVERERLQAACERAALLAKDGEIRLEGSAGGLCMTARTPEVGRSSERVGGHLTGEPFSIVLNVRYLLAGLRTQVEPEVILEFAGQRSAARFRSGPADPSFFAVLPLMNFG